MANGLVEYATSYNSGYWLLDPTSGEKLAGSWHKYGADNYRGNIGNTYAWIYNGDAVNVYASNGTQVAGFSGASQLASNKTGDLLAVKIGNKWAIATLRGTVTEANYDDVTVGSKLAVVKYGNKYGLAGQNGEILAPTYNSVSLHGEYAVCRGESGAYFLTTAAGIVSGIEESDDDFAMLENGWIRFGDGIYNDSMEYMGERTSSGIMVNEDDEYHYYALAGDELVELDTNSPKGFKDGSEYTALEWCVYWMGDDLYGLWTERDGYTDEAYSSSGEARSAGEAYHNELHNTATTEGTYKITKNDAGKPVVTYGGETVIEFYKNNFYYDEIQELGEGYFACRYNTDWYLVHA